MKSGYPHGQGGLCPTFQHEHNVYAPQENNESPALVYSADGMQSDIITNQYTEELGLAYCPDQTCQGLTQTGQKFHRLHHQQTRGGPHNPKLLTSLGGTSSTALKENSVRLDEHLSQFESKHPLLCTLLKKESQPFDTIQDLINTQSSLSAKTSVNVEHISSYFQDKRHNKSLQTKCSLASISYGHSRKQNLDHLKGVNVTCPQQQFLSPFLYGSSPNTPPTDEQILDFIEKSLEPYRSASDQQSGKHGATPLNKKWKLCSVIGNAILQSDCNNPKSNSVTHLSTTPESNVKRQGLTISMTEKCTARGGHSFKEDSSERSNEDIAFTFKTKVAADCATVASDKQSTEYPQIMRNAAATCTKNEDTSPVVLTPVSGMALHKATEKNGCTLLHNCSSMEEYKSPLLHISKMLDDMDKVSGVSWALKSTIETEKGESDPNAVEPVRMDCVKDVTDIPVAFQTKSVLLASQNNTVQLKSLITKDANTKKGKNNVDAHFQITCKEVMAHSEMNSSIQIQKFLSIPANQSCVATQKETHSVYLQSELGVTLSKNKVKESPPDQKIHSVNYLKDPQYEDISDDEGRSKQMTKRPYIKDLYYEDINEDEESQLKNIALKNTSRTQLPKNNIKQSTFEYKEYVVNQTQIKDILEEKLIPKKRVSSNTETMHVAQQSSSIACTDFTEHDDLSSSKCNSKKHTGWQASQPVYSPSCVIKENETYNPMEDDDDWIVIPVSMVDIQFEPKEPDKEHVGVELVMLHPEKIEFMERWDDTNPKQCRLHQPSPELVLPPSSSKIEVFDTFDSFVKAKSELFGFFKSTPSNELDPDVEPHNAQNRRESYSEPEDSCETEDSCDYSSGSEFNRLTVDKRLLREMSVPAPPDTDDSLSEEETEHKGINTQIAQTRSSRLLKLKEMSATRSTQNVTKKSDIIVLDSDTDDESDKNCKNKAKRKGLLSSLSEVGRNSLRDGSGQLIETQLGYEQVKHDVNRPNVSMQQIVINLDSDTDFSGSEDGGNTRKRDQVTEAREHFQREINRPTAFKRTIFPDSDKVIEKDMLKRMPTLERIASGSDDCSSTSFAEQNEPATQTVTCPYDTTSRRPKQITLSSKDLSDKLPQSVGKNADCADRMIDNLFVEEASQSGSYLKLLKESKSRDTIDDTMAVKTPTTKSATGTDRHCATNYNISLNIKKPKPTIGQMSLLEQNPSTFISNPTPAQFSQVRQISASEGMSQSVRTSVLSSLPKHNTNTSVPTQQLSSAKLKRSHSSSNNSTLEHPDILPKDLSSSTTQSFARKRVRNDWHTSYIPTRRDRKPILGTEELLRTTSCDSSMKAGPWHKYRATRQRHSSHKPATALMKKTKLEAIQRTKDINWATSSRQSNVVGKHYKWAEEQRQTKVSSSGEWNRH